MLLAISVQETSPADVQAYATQYGLTYPIGFDATSAVFKAYQAFGLPTQVFIDRQGIVRSVVRGPLDQPGPNSSSPRSSAGRRGLGNALRLAGLLGISRPLKHPGPWRAGPPV